MAGKESISPAQMGALLYMSVIGTAFLVMPSAATVMAGSDMWMTPVFAAIGGFIPVWAAIRLHRLYPGKHLFGAMEEALGRIAGRTAGIVFLLFHLHICGATLRDYSEFIAGNFFQQTPLVVLMASMLIVCAMALKAGIETLARCAQIFLPVVLALLLINVILLIPDMNGSEILPVLGNGPLPVAKGIVVVQGWFCQFVMISFLLPFVKSEKAARTGYWSVAAASATMVLINLTVLFLFGIDAAQFYYPFLMASRYIRVADFIEHVEAMVMASWVLGTFVRISLFYYTAAVGMAHCTGVKDDKLFVYPVGFLLVASAFWVAPSMQALLSFISTWGNIYIMTGYIAFPACLALVGMVRRASAKERANS
ncbi:endospore germination permease [Cohnella sp. GCM10020058]|uniref:GerAB/ArcD/ProY family transporter n=1 Tax=Cohnella sp. GCM10020058 TaxID=3317330 RepID=UPI0036422344